MAEIVSSTEGIQSTIVPIRIIEPAIGHGFPVDDPKTKNLVMTLTEFGIKTPVRFVLTNYGPRFSPIDTVMAATGYKQGHAGNTLKTIADATGLYVSWVDKQVSQFHK
jgi:hypothetical protein